MIQVIFLAVKCVQNTIIDKGKSNLNLSLFDNQNTLNR